MHRWTSLVFGLLFVAAVAGIVMASRKPAVESSIASASASASASSSPPLADAENPVRTDPVAPIDAGADSAASSAFHVLADGGPVPTLSDDAPKRVQLGVVLFQYKGAQGAPTNSRSKDAARSKAQDTIELAKKDFDEAVKLGDPGSLGNAGDIPRNVLEPVIEYTVFRMEPGAVYPEPLDTPRGYWIVRRIK